MGYRRLDDDEGGKNIKTSDTDNEPFPVIVFGLNKPVSSNKIGKYLTGSFYYYLDIYKNINRFGLPFDKWTDSPQWLLKLVDMFDEIKDEYGAYKKAKGLI
jgi:hypothetical protein